MYSDLVRLAERVMRTGDPLPQSLRATAENALRAAGFTMRAPLAPAGVLAVALHLAPLLLEMNNDATRH